MNEQDRDYGAEQPRREWPARRRLYRGWWVVLVGFFALTIASRAQVDTGFDILSSLERGRVRAGQEGFPTNTEYYLLIGVILVLAPVAGLLVDRFGPSAVIVPVMVGASVTLAFTGITGEIWLGQLTWLVLWGVLAGALLIGFVKAVTPWFLQNRGKALAVLLAGVMLAPVLPFPRIQRIAHWFLPYDFSRGVWPDFRMLQVVDISVLLMIGIIPAYFVLRRRFRNSWSARREGLLLIEKDEPDEEEEPSVVPVDEETPTLKTIFLDRSYLLLVVASGLQASAIALLPLVGSGFWSYVTLPSPLRVSQSLWPFGIVPIDIAVTGAIVVLVSGILTDRFGGRRVALGTIVTQLICVGIVVLEIEGVNILAFAIAIGAGVGVLCVPIVFLIAEFAGTRHLGVFLGILASVTLGSYWLAREQYVSAAIESDFLIPYSWLPHINVVMLILALILIILMKRPQPAPIVETPEPQAAT